MVAKTYPIRPPGKTDMYQVNPNRSAEVRFSTQCLLNWIFVLSDSFQSTLDKDVPISNQNFTWICLDPCNTFVFLFDTEEGQSHFPSEFYP